LFFDTFGSVLILKENKTQSKGGKNVEKKTLDLLRSIPMQAWAIQ
jgi:hypothetical protein